MLSEDDFLEDVAFDEAERRRCILRDIAMRIKENGIHIMVQIQVIYGTKISEIAKSISDAVLYSVESSTGLKVESLDIKISGIRVVE